MQFHLEMGNDDGAAELTTRATCTPTGRPEADDLQATPMSREEFKEFASEYAPNEWINPISAAAAGLISQDAMRQALKIPWIFWRSLNETNQALRTGCVNRSKLHEAR